MTMEWTITIEGRDEFGEVRRQQIQIDKSWERLRDGEIGLSIDDGKKIMIALQSAVGAGASGRHARDSHIRGAERILAGVGADNTYSGGKKCRRM